MSILLLQPLEGVFMSLINWSDDLSVGVDEFDSQHKVLIKMINDLSGAMRQGKGKDVINEIINGLITYTKTHFNAEEQCFAKFNYPQTNSHKKEHTEFIQKISEFKDGFDKGSLSLSIEVMSFLSGWLKKHIKGTDQKYTKFLNDSGIK